MFESMFICEAQFWPLLLLFESESCFSIMYIFLSIIFLEDFDPVFNHNYFTIYWLRYSTQFAI